MARLGASFFCREDAQEPRANQRLRGRERLVAKKRHHGRIRRPPEDQDDGLANEVRIGVEVGDHDLGHRDVVDDVEPPDATGQDLRIARFLDGLALALAGIVRRLVVAALLAHRLPAAEHAVHPAFVEDLRRDPEDLLERRRLLTTVPEFQ